MATQKEIKDFLKRTGYTEADIQNFWNENIETNFIIKNLNNHGKTWKDLNMSCIERLPTQKERDLSYKKEQELIEINKKIEEEREKEEKNYYLQNFEKIILQKIDNKEELTKTELVDLIEYEIDRTIGEKRRWYRTIISTVELSGRYFNIEREEGLTEYQDYTYTEQPYEVKKVTKIVTQEITTWEAV